MAKDNETILIDVEVDTAKLEQELSSAVHSLQAMKEEQKRLTSEITKGNDVNGIYAHQLVQVQKKIEENSRAIKSKTGLLQAAQIEEVKNTQSLDDQRQVLNTLQKAYANLSGEEKKAADAKGGLRDKIKELSDSVKSQEQAIGDARRNVGNYKEALEQAGVGIGAFEKKMKALWANPWAAIIGAIALVVKKLVDAFKSSEDRMREMQTAFAPFRAGIDVIKQAFDALAKVLSKVVVAALDKVADGMDWLAKKLDALGKLFGKEWGLSDKLEEAKKNTQAIAAEEQAYIDHKRRLVTENAVLEKEISDLRTKAAEKDKYTNAERVALLEQAAAKEEKIYAEKKKLAQEYLSLLQKQAAESENDAAANDALAEAEAAVILADKELSDKKRELVAQIVEAKNADKAATAQSDKAADDELKKAEELEKKRAEIRIGVEKALQDELVALIEDETDRKLAAEQLAFEREVEALKEQQNILAENDIEGRENINTLIQAKQIEHNQKMAEINATADEQFRQSLEQRKRMAIGNAAAINGAISGLTAILDQFSEDNKDAAIASKAIALGQIAVQTGIAIATGVAQSQSVPFPANIAAIATTIGVVLGNIASAISTVKSAKFATGGIVEGKYDARDSVRASLSGGEMVLNPAQQKTLFEMANTGKATGLNYELLGQTMAAAVAAQPAPIMDYTEFKKFGQKVSTYKEIASV